MLKERIVHKCRNFINRTFFLAEKIEVFTLPAFRREMKIRVVEEIITQHDIRCILVLSCIMENFEHTQRYDMDEFKEELKNLSFLDDCIETMYGLYCVAQNNKYKEK